MHLQRIQVPDFRALKNVDISFEKEFTPRIFPLGSQNGGGKSTLLQLIFVLLHCAGNPDRVEFIQNLLYGFHVNDELGGQPLAIIDIRDGSDTIRLDFFVCNESFISKFLKEGYKDTQVELINYYNFHEQKFINEKISSLASRITQLESDLFFEEGSTLQEATKIEIRKLQSKIEEEYFLCENFQKILIDSFEDHNLLYICDFHPSNNNSYLEKLVCKVDGIDISEIKKILPKLSDKIFLTAHISQIFLFLQPDNRKSLFKKQENNQTNYYQQIKAANFKLPGFFTYDFLAIDILIEAFKKARDDDFKQAVEQGGNYGNNYVKLLDELNNLLSNKKINVQPDLSGINFKIDGDETELYPEDLSHGELKRLCIYMWLKHNKIEDAIVLMDELEISFHPDWQYQIVRDLEEWGATNQYILATHSYELCNAVTPAHVKELDPKLQSKTIQ
jgi:predicted ATP-dependent endonuclease of OLD family